MGIAIVSVIASAVVGVSGIGATVWNSLQPGKVARQGRIEQRHADAYVEVLRLAEQDALYYNSRYTNMLITSTEDWPDIEARVAVPESAGIDSRASISALIAAFASTEVADRHRTWRMRHDEVMREFGELAFYWTETLNGSRPVELEKLKPLRYELLPGEAQARTALADQIANELGHRVQRRGLRRS